MILLSSPLWPLGDALVFSLIVVFLIFLSLCCTHYHSNIFIFARLQHKFILFFSFYCSIGSSVQHCWSYRILVFHPAYALHLVNLYGGPRYLKRETCVVCIMSSNFHLDIRICVSFSKLTFDILCFTSTHIQTLI